MILEGLKNVVEMRGIQKVYPNGVVANTDVDFAVAEGEIHALVGENGAGKSTLMKILFGIEQPTGGVIAINGVEEKIQSVAQALSLGLGMVQQHVKLVPSMTVSENVLLGAEPVKGLLVDGREAERRTRELCEKYSFRIDPGTRVDMLSVGDRQKVEIMKVLYRKAKVIILDEPTAVLTPQETEELFKQLLILKSHGHTIVFISHKLQEIRQICDRVTIMRKGTTVGTYYLKDITTEKISEYMMGHEAHLRVDKRPAKPGEVCLKVEDLSFVTEEDRRMLGGVSFSLRSGEILGVVGVEGNGQTELVEIIAGLKKPSGGSVSMNGTPLEGKSIVQVREMSFAYIPQDRMATGAALDCSLAENMASVIYRKKENQNGPLLDWKKLRRVAVGKIQEYKVKTDSEKTPIGMLSGGNIQKAVVAREFMGSPRIIVAEQPTRGIDVGAANLIHNKLVELRDAGSAVLLVSSDLSEVMSLSDSIIVMYGGKICAFFSDVSELQESDLGFYMLGVKRQTEEEIGRCRHE